VSERVTKVSVTIVDVDERTSASSAMALDKERSMNIDTDGGAFATLKETVDEDVSISVCGDSGLGRGENVCRCSAGFSGRGAMYRSHLSDQAEIRRSSGSFMRQNRGNSQGGMCESLSNI